VVNSLRRMSSGARSSRWTSCITPLSTLRRKKSTPSTLNSTTRLTRFEAHSFRAHVENFPADFHLPTTLDQEGRPLYIEQLGKLDLTKLYKVTTQERQLQRLVVEYERVSGSYSLFYFLRTSLLTIRIFLCIVPAR
jgi:hypothetical protein